jgi:hypothetical protein
MIIKEVMIMLDLKLGPGIKAKAEEINIDKMKNIIILLDLIRSNKIDFPGKKYFKNQPIVTNMANNRPPDSNIGISNKKVKGPETNISINPQNGCNTTKIEIAVKIMKNIKASTDAVISLK